MKLSALLAETDMVQNRPWPDGIYYEDDPAADTPETGRKPPDPTSYYAATTALGPQTTRGSHTGASRRNFAQSADDWLLARYLHSRWTRKIHKGSHR